MKMLHFHAWPMPFWEVVQFFSLYAKWVCCPSLVWRQVVEDIPVFQLQSLLTSFARQGILSKRDFIVQAWRKILIFSGCRSVTSNRRHEHIPQETCPELVMNTLTYSTNSQARAKTGGWQSRQSLRNCGNAVVSSWWIGKTNRPVEGIPAYLKCFGCTVPKHRLIFLSLWLQVLSITNI